MVKPGAVVIDVGINRVDDASHKKDTASWVTWTSRLEIRGAITRCRRMGLMIAMLLAYLQAARRTGGRARADGRSPAA
jgi:5,10-methylene-tetrahydrofolate dehydrogenase/methenyl tetrahydrofolate cyclohydrolase